MVPKKLRKKQGVVILLDALGASEYTEEKIRKFLAVRTTINSMISDLAKSIPVKAKLALSVPSIYTFGDTIVITMQIKGARDIDKQIFCACLLMRRYLFHSFEEGILFRGAFSIGSYIEDSEGNTVMGEAVTDAAQWYEKANWMGLSATPKTNNVLEYYLSPAHLSNPEYLCMYPVPIKSNTTIDLYSISWPGAFYNDTIQKHRKQTEPRKWFLEIFKDFSFPAHAVEKYQNTKKFFLWVESERAKHSIESVSPNIDKAPRNTIQHAPS